MKPFDPSKLSKSFPPFSLSLSLCTLAKLANDEGSFANVEDESERACVLFYSRYRFLYPNEFDLVDMQFFRTNDFGAPGLLLTVRYPVERLCRATEFGNSCFPTSFFLSFFYYCRETKIPVVESSVEHSALAPDWSERITTKS